MSSSFFPLPFFHIYLFPNLPSPEAIDRSMVNLFRLWSDIRGIFNFLFFRLLDKLTTTLGMGFEVYDVTFISHAYNTVLDIHTNIEWRKSKEG